MNEKMLIEAIYLVAGMIDNLVFGGTIFGDSEEKSTYRDKNPLIGRRMKVGDNSYCIDKETGCDAALYGKEVVVVSSPYKEEVSRCCDKEHLFIDVASLDSGRRYRVLFRESWLIPEDEAQGVETQDFTDSPDVEDSVKPRNYWTWETISKEASKYKSRIEFKRGSRGAYDAALRLGCMGVLFPKY